MLSLRNILFSLAVSASVAQAERLRVVWSAGSFSAITYDGSPTGSTGNYEGFAIIRDDGQAIYDESYPYGYSPCFNTGGGRTFEIAGDCWDSSYRFHCEADFGGVPESCSVQSSNGDVIDSGSGEKDTTFIGISIGIDGSCVAEFESDGGGCPVDDGNGPLHAQGKEV